MRARREVSIQAILLKCLSGARGSFRRWAPNMYSGHPKFGPPNIRYRRAGTLEELAQSSQDTPFSTSYVYLEARHNRECNGEGYDL